MGAVSDQMVPTCAVGAGDGDRNSLGNGFPRWETMWVVTVRLHMCRRAAVITGDFGGGTFEGRGAVALDMASFTAALASSPGGALCAYVGVP
jgi:hypothetical protein